MIPLEDDVPSHIDATLRDGRPVRLRPVRPDDKWRLVEVYDHLSEESRFHRFHTTISKLSDGMLRYLTEVDQHDHVAWGAFDPRDDAEHGYGVVRAVRLPEEPTVAELAITVADEVQQQGLGTLLVGLVGGLAMREGVRTLRFETTEDNLGMITLLRRLGAQRTEIDYPNAIYDLPLPVPVALRPEVQRVIDQAMRLAA